MEQQTVSPLASVCVWGGGSGRGLMSRGRPRAWPLATPQQPANRQKLIAKWGLTLSPPSSSLQPQQLIGAALSSPLGAIVSDGLGSPGPKQRSRDNPHAASDPSSRLIVSKQHWDFATADPGVGCPVFPAHCPPWGSSHSSGAMCVFQTAPTEKPLPEGGGSASAGGRKAS